MLPICLWWQHCCLFVPRKKCWLVSSMTTVMIYTVYVKDSTFWRCVSSLLLRYTSMYFAGCSPCWFGRPLYSATICDQAGDGRVITELLQVTEARTVPCGQQAWQLSHTVVGFLQSPGREMFAGVQYLQEEHRTADSSSVNTSDSTWTKNTE